jgi:hypothetical protein
MWTRRDFLNRSGRAGVAALATFNPAGLPRLLEATAGVGQRAPGDVAQDETYWREIQQAFTLDRTLINLNNGIDAGHLDAVPPRPLIPAARGAANTYDLVQ